ncbi:MAG: hypothetical protein JWP30_1244, partial [Homoserinimonas sp.]|nr:hypothetical protein [Homoserinimonas sp.]
DGQWFPRVEMQEHAGDIVAVFRQRQAPALARSITLATHAGADPRTQPTVKGPDTGTLSQLRAEAQLRGADDAVILSSDGYVVEAAHSALAWWRGDILCVPPLELDRVDSVTARTVIALATALGTEVHYESATPENLDGREIWSLNALHGIRIVTHWIDGPQTAEEPGRLGIWRARLDRLRKPIVVSSAR